MILLCHSIDLHSSINADQWHWHVKPLRHVGKQRRKGLGKTPGCQLFWNFLSPTLIASLFIFLSIYPFWYSFCRLFFEVCLFQFVLPFAAPTLQILLKNKTKIAKIFSY